MLHEGATSKISTLKKEMIRFQINKNRILSCSETTASSIPTRSFVSPHFHHALSVSITTIMPIVYILENRSINVYMLNK